MEHLDLYSKVEHLLGIEEATKYLHQIYAEVLYNYEIKTLLDVGCGRGDLMKTFEKYGVECEGIDLSPLMVKKAQENGLKAEHKSICEVDKQYDAVVAVFDVLNFVSPEEIEGFFECVHRALKEDGIFVFDINTLHGFSNVADGTMSQEEGDDFLSVDAVFKDNQLHTKFTYFSKEGEHYKKEQETIVQYFHPLKWFKKLKKFKVVQSAYLDLYDQKDKGLIVLKKA